MLRIMMPGQANQSGQASQPPQAPPQAPQPDPTQDPTQASPDDPTQDPDADSDSDPQMIGHKIPAKFAGYLGPENGPFQCSNCRFFEAPNSCSVVDGAIDPAGCCNNFTGQNAPSEDAGSEAPDEESPVSAPEDVTTPPDEGNQQGA